MLTFFPEPYPDEILYSVFARYHLRSANSSFKDTLQDLFDSKTVIPTIDLPSHIGEVIKKLPHGTKLTASKLINEHTLLPFYAKSLPVDRLLKIEQMMMSDNGDAIHMISGITAGGICKKNNLYYCSCCMKDDVMKFGETYWHRVHQIPGVFICPIHNKFLRPHITTDRSRHEYIPLPISFTEEAEEITESKISRKTREYLYMISENLGELLSLKRATLFNSNKWSIKALYEKGLVTASNRIRQKDLHEQFLLYYGEEFLKIMDSDILKDNSWLSNAVRKPRKALHPIRHILLINFLFGNLDKFQQTEVSNYSTFGSGPWPCLNRAAVHFGKNIITECIITRCSDTGLPVGNFICDCGFCYSRRGPDITGKSRFNIGRIKAFGFIWFAKLEELAKSNSSYRSIARDLNVDTNTVIKYTKKIRNGELQKITDKENNLIRSFNAHKSATKKLKNTVKKTRLRVNWEMRDLEISYLVEKECKKVLSCNNIKPKRITSSLIGRRIGKHDVIIKNVTKLPITDKVLKQYIETPEEHRIRRIRWAISSLSRNNEEIKSWKVARIAGIRRCYNHLVDTEIECHFSSLGYINNIDQGLQIWKH